MSQSQIHPNWYYTVGKKTQAGTLQLTAEGLTVLKGKKIELSIAYSDIQQISKEMDKKDPVVKILEVNNQVFIFKPLAIGESNLDPLVDQLIAAIEAAR
ncbi:MAG TPA: hypothetical protein VKK79_02325 [Candidatus Lokiarchaeia archaeon]|nr:hypothetical protein [Candidatus Lokiarchaeia archaeon]